MSSSTRKISPSEWAQHKDSIVELYRGNTLKDVRAMMQDQHNFDASPWQYEAQLKRWNIRKNATRKEWQQYFAANNNQPSVTSADYTATPVILSKPTASKKRASRWALGGSQVSTPTKPSNRSRVLPRLMPTEPHAAETINEADVQDMDIAISQDIFPNSDLAGDLPSPFGISGILDADPLADHNQLLLHCLAGPSLDLTYTYSPPVVPESLSLYSGNDCPQLGQDISSFLGLPAESNMVFFCRLKETDFRGKLPSVQLEHNLRSRGIILDQVSGSPMLGRFASKVVAGILSSTNQFTGMTRQTPNLQRFLRRLESQIPGEDSDLITDSQAFETKFARMLLVSMLNGFAGLDDVPMENILRFLNRFVVNKLLLDILCQCSRYARKTLTDNIFRAAIEAADAKVLALLLGRKLIDVKGTICLHNGKRYTPIERAVALRCPSVVKLLIDSGADIQDCPGVLLEGIEGYLEDHEGQNIPPDSFETLNLLVAAGAQLRPRMMIRRARSSEIDYFISQHICPESHQEFFLRDPDWTEESAPVRYIARLLDDSRAAKAIQKAINLCYESNCKNCLANAGSLLGGAAIDAASKGKLDTLQLLLEKADLKAKLTQIFTGAIKSGSSPLIGFILSLGPGLDPPALKEQHPRFRDLKMFRTPIAETVRYENVDLRQELENNGCLAHLSEGNRFEALLQAAAEAGDVPYLRDLLAYAVTSKNANRELMWTALVLALREGHKDVVWMLLGAGATFSNVKISSWKYRWESLVESLGQEDVQMIHAFIDAGALAKQVRAYIAKADYSIIVDMAYEYPGFRLEGADLELLLAYFIKEDALQAFRDLLQHLSPQPRLLEYCLKGAVKMGHVELVGYLLDIGTDPFLDAVLREVVETRPDMLSLLLQSERPRQTIPACIGTRILATLMLHGDGNTEALNELIRTRAINFTRLEIPFRDIPDVENDDDDSSQLTPLGMAIQGVPNKFDANMTTMTKFLEAGADPNGISKSSFRPTTGSPLMTALMAAVETGREEAVTILLDHGADVNARPRIRTTRTALQYAAELGSLDMVRLLLARGADANGPAPPRGGATAIQFAAMSGNCNLVEYLLDHGADLGGLPSRIDGMWPLEGAAAKGRLDMISYLWELNAMLVARGTFVDGFLERHCLRAMKFARENAEMGCMELISDLSGIAVERLETDEYGAPWIAY